MADSPRDFLAHMLDCAEFLVEFAKDQSSDVLSKDRIVRSGVERELSIIGEALYQLHDLDPETAMRVDGWRSIIRFRHVLVHGYSRVKLDALWDVITDDLPPLIEQVKTIRHSLTD